MHVMGNIRVMGPQSDQTVHVRLPGDDYARLRYYLMKKGHLRGGVTAFVQEAVRRYLKVVEGEPSTFEEEFMSVWKKPPRAFDKWCCYGAAIDMVPNGIFKRQVGRFTIDELQTHHDTSRWDERTYVLVDEQIKRHREAGLVWNEQRTLIPPVPKTEIPEDDLVFRYDVSKRKDPPQITPVMRDPPAEPPKFVFDPAKTCFLAVGSCPQPEECLRVGGCCADPPIEDDDPQEIR